MRYFYFFILAIFLISELNALAQVKISSNNNTTIDANAILHLDSDTLGLLPPIVVINDLNSPAPLTAPVTTGMLVFSSGGSVSNGYYFWNGSKWDGILATGENMLATSTYTTNTTLSKTDNIVLASNDITLTLPAITADDNGLQITVKNNGLYLDLITVVGDGGATIDGENHSSLTRFMGETYFAYEGNWLLTYNVVLADNLLDVAANGSWTTIEQVVEFLNEHMTGPTVVRLGAETFTISSTQVIDLPYSVTFEGLSYGATFIEPESAFTGGLFSCTSECYFKMLSFSSTYGSTSGHDAILLTGPGEYYEIKDFDITGFNKGVKITNNCEVWVFDGDISDCVSSGIEIAAGTSDGVSFKISETDFNACGNGINMLSGTNAIISIINCTFYASLSTNIGVNYVPATFTTFSSMFITNNAWNNIGKFFNGFDFSRSDGRDAKAFIQNNAGYENKNPHCNKKNP